MFDKFGEFDSYEELNTAAEVQLVQGDTESLKKLAAENGIDEEDVADYLNADTYELATPLTSALGRMKIEEENCKNRPVHVIINMIRNMLEDEALCLAVMKKGVRAEQIYNLMKEAAKKHSEGGSGVSCGTDKQLRDIIRAYYLKGEAEAQEVIEKLY